MSSSSSATPSRRSNEGNVELGQHEGVDPLGVRAPGDVARELGTDVLDESVAHAAELAQVPVVREHDARAGEVERVQVGLGDGGVLGVGDPADVRDEAGRLELGGEAAQVAVEARQVVAR
jgi:hypothetical protein